MRLRGYVGCYSHFSSLIKTRGRAQGARSTYCWSSWRADRWGFAVIEEKIGQDFVISSFIFNKNIIKEFLIINMYFGLSKNGVLFILWFTCLNVFFYMFLLGLKYTERFLCSFPVMNWQYRFYTVKIQDTICNCSILQLIILCLHIMWWFHKYPNFLS